MPPGKRWSKGTCMLSLPEQRAGKVVGLELLSQISQKEPPSLARGKARGRVQCSDGSRFHQPPGHSLSSCPFSLIPRATLGCPVLAAPFLQRALGRRQRWGWRQLKQERNGQWRQPVWWESPWPVRPLSRTKGCLGTWALSQPPSREPPQPSWRGAFRAPQGSPSLRFHFVFRRRATLTANST